jgi:signal transduction histidine kinase
VTTRIQSLTDSLLHYAVLGSQSLEWEECDLGELVQESLDLVELLVREKGIAVRVPGDLPRLITHPPFLVEILCNLISNAAKYADKPEPYVEVSAWQASDGSLVIEVSDNGIGVHPDDHERIFHMLERLPGAEKYGFGVGMGLSISKRLLARLSGTISLRSVLGQGSCFRLQLPRMQV